MASTFFRRLLCAQCISKSENKMARKQSFLENVRYLECLTYDEFALFSYTIDVLSPDLNNDEDLYLLELPKIQRIHQLLFAPNVEHAGQIRTKNVKPSGMLPVYANYMDISAQLASLIKKTNSMLVRTLDDDGDDESMESTYHEIVKHFYVRFLKIHPFEDGNGRMARILLALLLRVTRPYCTLLTSRADFLDALFRAHNDNYEKIDKIFHNSIAITKHLK
ncbi:FIC protein-like protein [Oryctes rhinoceros nudivirus]|uniref:FIC protein-like protein n=1 Tax=Oryctes rhinoceros nudivirus TaxID=92521 RepID=B7SV90_9VIRU|nr:FIC protein-like protein [Oryctes rhinoceros nudivirus]ACH96199.1 FIC protein-like protein [Oryctes rhinoceros nudivirus]QHG11304.1 FIC protein-like protein [Oryctes rhinoceros nudivirus]UBR58249.1 FIC-like protein [Oryctes rhinoceros nudivirus]UBR58381.1 FIC-like protein [Oryctes rhinoceros nudivirus]